MNRWIITVAAVSMLLLSGCLEYEDELTIFSDGAGEHRVLVGQSLELDDMDGMDVGAELNGEGFLDEDLASDFTEEGVDILSVRSFTDTRVSAHNEEVDYAFQEIVVRYDQVVDSSWFDEQSGAVHFERRDDGSYRFERVFRSDEMTDEEQDTVDAAQMRGFISMLFPDAVFRFIVELPADVETADLQGRSADIRPAIDGSRVTWEIPLFEIMGGTGDFVMIAETVEG